MLFFKPSYDQFESEFEKGKYILLWRLSIIFGLLFLILSLLVLMYNPYSAMLYILAFCICTYSYFHLTFTHNTRHSFWIFSVSASAVVIFSMFTLMTTLHYPDFLWVVCTIVFAYIGLGQKHGLIFLIIHTISFILYFYFGMNDHILHLKPLSFAELTSVLFELLIALMALTYLIISYLKFQKNTENKLLVANQNLTQKNDENNLLLKEIHHRIKNNLQLVISLLRMQQQEFTQDELKAYFDEAINRVLSISMIHERLYQSENLSRFDLNLYVHDLVDQLKSMDVNGHEIQTKIKLNVDRLGLKTVVPFGLLLNELVTNSLKHAFKASNRQAVIFIRLEKLTENQITFSYSDTGTWKESDKKGFGTELIELLVDQLEGSILRENSSYTITFKNLDLA
jgi:two-component system, sensor histidine kinase PdtaS